jgi:hypothetical protein
MDPMGVLLTFPSRSCVQVQVPVEATSWEPGHQLFLKYAGIQPRHVDPTSQEGPGTRRGVGNTTHSKSKDHTR